ncbi:MAG: VCBS repeat-containing protein [Planctomycetota bacterium]|nr:VCBS repeat-containing protein [Planctomycetota bacterium]
MALVLLFGACSDQAEVGPAPTAAPEAATDRRVWFRDVTAKSGLDFVHEAGFTAEKHLPETMGAGAALIDVDADGDLDAYLVQGGPLPLGPEPRAVPPNRLYLNDGAGRFTDHTEASGDAADGGYGMGVTAGDVDGDGKLDLFVTNFGADVLLLGDGAGGFTDGTAASGIRDDRWTGGAVLFDADADGDLDLYVSAYVLVDLEHPAWCGERRPGWRSTCHPDHFEGLQDRFWRNRGNGRFDDHTASAGMADSSGKGLGVVASDLDGDGDLDLYVANDSVENRFWRNAGDGTFVDDTLLTGTGVNRHGATEAGMGLAAGDVDGDGDFDLYVTNFDDESNTLYRNDGGDLFTDGTVPARLEVPSRLPVGFGAVMEDFDLDGDLDLAVANGHIIDNIHLYHDGKRWPQPAQLYVNRGRGVFDHEPDLAGDLGREPLVGRGLFSGDLDGDAVPDLLLTQCGGPALVLRNEARGPALVVEGLPFGTRVEARTSDGRVLVRQYGGAPSYFGLCDERVFLGAGPGQSFVEITIRTVGGERKAFAIDPPRSSGTVRFSESEDGWQVYE